jgi:hypothetical protein
MKANVQYNDFTGTASADISDFLGGAGGDDVEGLSKYFDLNYDRFTPVGISIYGTENFGISLICVDKEKSTEEKEHIVKMSCNVEDQKEIIDILFKRLNVTLFDKYDKKYPNMEYDQEVNFDDYHETEEE